LGLEIFTLTLATILAFGTGGFTTGRTTLGITLALPATDFFII